MLHAIAAKAMSRHDPLDLVKFLNRQLVCLREEINAEQWSQANLRLEHIKAMIEYHSPLYRPQE